MLKLKLKLFYDTYGHQRSGTHIAKAKLKLKLKLKLS